MEKSVARPPPTTLLWARDGDDGVSFSLSSLRITLPTSSVLADGFSSNRPARAQG